VRLGGILIMATGPVGGDVGCAASGQIFTTPVRGGKLKNWKPDALHRIADRRDFSFSEFQDFTRITGTGEGVTAVFPGATLRPTSSLPA
jgi:hypothetical protein